MREHHELCATHKGREYFCDCILWDGSSRFAAVDESLDRFKQLTDAIGRLYDEKKSA